MRKISIILSTFLIIFTFLSSTNIYPVKAQDIINENIGVYSYDIASGEENFIPDSKEVSAYSNRDTELNTYAFVPDGLSLDPPSTAQTYTVFNDNWEEIVPATDGQYRNTVYLDITTTNGSYRGTGFMLGPNTVATCGHCIYHNAYGSNPWATSIRVIPAMADDSYPYGSAYATSVIVNSNWKNYEDEEYDWGIIRLNTNIGNSVGWLGLKSQTDTYNNTSVDVNGYPVIVDGIEKFTMYRASGTVTASYAKILHSNNINNLGGMSGGPMYIYSSQYGYQAIAFTRGETPSYNVYVRIDEQLFDRFASYIDLTA